MRIVSVILMLLIALSVQAKFIEQNPAAKTVMISDGSGHLQLQIDYSKGCKISQVRQKS